MSKQKYNWEFDYVQEHIKKNCPNVAKLSKQLNEPQCVNLFERYTLQEVLEQLNAMENYAPLAKKYTSVYLTLLKWFKLDEAKGLVSGTVKKTTQTFARPVCSNQSFIEPDEFKKLEFLKRHPVNSKFKAPNGKTYLIESETFLREVISGDLIHITTILRSI